MTVENYICSIPFSVIFAISRMRHKSLPTSFILPERDPDESGENRRIRQGLDSRTR